MTGQLLMIEETWQTISTKYISLAPFFLELGKIRKALLESQYRINLGFLTIKVTVTVFPIRIYVNTTCCNVDVCYVHFLFFHLFLCYAKCYCMTFVMFISYFMCPYDIPRCTCIVFAT